MDEQLGDWIMVPALLLGSIIKQTIDASLPNLNHLILNHAHLVYEVNGEMLYRPRTVRMPAAPVIPPWHRNFPPPPPIQPQTHATEAYC